MERTKGGGRHRPAALTPAQGLQLTLIWPIVGTFIVTGLVIGMSMVGDKGIAGLPPLDVRQVFLRFASWALLTPLIVLLAILVRPQASSWRAIGIIHGTAAMLLPFAFGVLLDRGLPTFERPAGLLSAVAFRTFAYGGIVLTIWAILLFEALARSVRDELRSATALAESSSRHLANTGIYLYQVLGDIEAVLPDGRRGEALTLAISSCLREQLRSVTAIEWTFVDEVRLIDRLVDVELARGAEAHITFDIAEEVRDSPVTPGWLLGPVIDALVRQEKAGRIAVIVDADERYLTGSVRSAEETIPLSAFPRGDASEETTLDVVALARTRSGLLIAFACVVCSIALTLSRVDLGQPLSGFPGLIAPIRAIAWTAAVWLAVSLAPLRMVGRWKAMLAITIASAWCSEWLTMVGLGAILDESWSLYSLHTYTSISLLSLSPPAHVACALGAALSVVRLAREYAGALGRDRLARAQLRQQAGDLLQQQMNPHFLFNALNSLIALLRRSPAEAKLFAQRLRAFHGAIISADNELVSVGKEIELTKEYLEIERTRFAQTIDVSIDIAGRADTALVPPLSIQSLVENAIKHGSCLRAGTPIHVEIEAVDERVVIRVVNHRDDARPSMPEGVGHRILEQRVRSLFGSAATLRFSKNGPLCEALLTLPMRRALAGSVCRPAVVS